MEREFRSFLDCGILAHGFLRVRCDRCKSERLSAANVPCELAVFPGLYHGGDAFVPHAAVSRRLQRSFLAALADALR